MKSTIADMATALVIYQAVYEILDENVQERLDKMIDEKLLKFSSQHEEITKQFVDETKTVEDNCEKFCMMAIEGLANMLEENFPVENESK